MVIIVRDKDDNTTLADWSVDNNYPIPNIGDKVSVREPRIGSYIPYRIEVIDRVFSIGHQSITLITDYTL